MLPFSHSISRPMQFLRTISYSKSMAQKLQEKPPAAAKEGVIIDEFKNFAKVTLSNPDHLNCMNLEAIKGFLAELPKLENKKAYWIQGAGNKAFTVGGDIKALYYSRKNNPKLLSDFFKYENTLNYKLSKMKAEQISHWNGYVMGSGTGMSMYTPYRIATEKTVFAMPEARIGFFTDVGGGFFLSRMRNYLGFYLGLTGFKLEGEQVYHAGLANYYIPSDKIPTVYEELKSEMAYTYNTETDESIDLILSKYHQGPKLRKLDHEEDIRFIFNSKSLEQVFQKLQQNKTPFYRSIKEAIESQCPLSVAVIFRALRQSRYGNTKENYIIDYAITQRFMKTDDFFEGVRCALINKGDTPRWSHKHWSEVTEEELNTIFEPLPESQELKL